MSEGIEKKLSSATKEFRKLRKKANSKRDLLILDLIYHTGCSVCELVKIKKSDIDFFSKKLRIPAKNSINKKERKIDIPESLVKNLYNFCTKEGFIFSVQNKQISTRRVEQIVSSCSKKAGVSFTPKKIRNIYLLKNILLGKTSQTGLKHIKPLALPEKEIKTEKERDNLIFEIVKETGCKTSQLKQIKKSNLAGRYIHIENCSFKLPDSLLKRINNFCAYKKNNEFIFTNKNNNPLTQRRIQQIFSSFAGTTPMQARREYACRQYGKGKSREKIKEELGLKRLDAFNYGLIKI